MKKNPNRIPISAADIKKAKAAAEKTAVDLASALCLTVLHDKFGFETDELARFWRELENLCDSIVKGYVKAPDMEQVLLEECGVQLKR